MTNFKNSEQHKTECRKRRDSRSTG